MRRLLLLPFATLLVNAALACADSASPARAREPIVGLPCDGCEAVFDGLPAELASTARIAPPSEPGEPMRIDGTVFDRDGKPAPGVVVYAHHTDPRGIYPRDGRAAGPAARHGRLRGWVRTDAHGRYRFETIRPGGYPNSDIPQHVHMQLIEVGRCTYYLDDLLFDDDPRLTAAKRSALAGRGGPGIVVPRRDANGTWLVTRDVRLRENVPGTERCDRDQ